MAVNSSKLAASLSKQQQEGAGAAASNDENAEPNLSDSQMETTTAKMDDLVMVTPPSSQQQQQQPQMQLDLTSGAESAAEKIKRMFFGRHKSEVVTADGDTNFKEEQFAEVVRLIPAATD